MLSCVYLKGGVYASNNPRLNCDTLSIIASQGVFPAMMEKIRKHKAEMEELDVAEIERTRKRGIIEDLLEKAEALEKELADS